MFKKTALCAGAVLLAIIVVRSYLGSKHSPWTPAAVDEVIDASKPLVKVTHPEDLDYAFRTGSLIPVHLEVHLPPGMVLESDTTIKGDLKMVERKVVYVEKRDDGATWYLIELKLQALDFKQPWVSFVTLMARQGDAKPVALKPAGIMVYGSMTYDGRKEKYAKDPYTEALPHSLLPTFLWLFTGIVGAGACQYILVQRKPRQPKPKPVIPPPPVDPYDAVDAAFTTVTSGDRSKEALAALVKQVRRFWRLENLTFQEVHRRGQTNDKDCAVVLQICEERAVWGDKPLSTREWLHLRQMQLKLKRAHENMLKAERAKMPRPPGRLRRLASWVFGRLKWGVSFLRRKPQSKQ